MSTSADPSDHELMRRIQAGHAESFAALYDRLAPAALQLAQGVLSIGDERAQNTVQESFLAIWRNRDAYRPERGEVRSWVMGVVGNRAIDNWRLGDDDRAAAGADEAMEREVMALAHFGQLSHSEIAAQLAVPSGTVKARLGLGLARLREQLFASSSRH